MTLRMNVFAVLVVLLVCPSASASSCAVGSCAETADETSLVQLNTIVKDRSVQPGNGDTSSDSKSAANFKNAEEAAPAPLNNVVGGSPAVDLSQAMSQQHSSEGLPCDGLTLTECAVRVCYSPFDTCRTDLSNFLRLCKNDVCTAVYQKQLERQPPGQTKAEEDQQRPCNILCNECWGGKYEPDKTKKMDAYHRAVCSKHMKGLLDGNLEPLTSYGPFGELKERFGMASPPLVQTIGAFRP